MPPNIRVSNLSFGESTKSAFGSKIQAFRKGWSAIDSSITFSTAATTATTITATTAAYAAIIATDATPTTKG